MSVDVRLVTFGALLLLSSSGLLLRAGVSDYLAAALAVVAAVGAAVALLRVGGGDAHAA
jgi:hypothetical protein